MAINDFYTGLTCANDGAVLVRVPQTLYRIPETEPDTSIVCTNCGAIGWYEQVVKQGAGLINGLLTHKQCAEIVKQLSVVPDGP
jgi:hypothetical protein